jgi:isopenicillin-N epimerase
VPSAQEIRRDFALDPDVAYLNHGAFGATPEPVLEHQAQLRLELERAPVAFLHRDLADALDGVRRTLSSYLGADPRRLVFTRNATTALNAVALSLDLAPGDEVVVTELEYGAMQLLWSEVARRTGAEIVSVRIRLPATGDDEIVETVWSRVSDRTRALFVSHITSETALVLPVARLCRHAREAGILAIVDGAHGPGQLNLSLDDLGADAYAGNGHKWLCAPKGCAFLYVGDALRDQVAPPVVSWGWAPGEGDCFHGRFSWVGTDDPTAVLSLPAALSYLDAIDWPSVRERRRRLARDAQAEALRRLGEEPIAPPELQAPTMVAFPAPLPDAEEAAHRLRALGIEIPVHRVGDRTLVRLSVAPYTTVEDCDRLVEALADLAAAPRTTSRNAKSR